MVRNERGSALLITLFVVIVVLTLGLTFANLSASEVKAAAFVYRSARAFQIAEAGLNRAMAAISAVGAWPGDLVADYAGGRYTVSGARNGGNYDIVSVGEYEGVRRTVTATVTLTLSAAGTKALFSEGDIHFDGPTRIEGDVYATGSASADAPVKIDGDLYLGGTLTDPGHNFDVDGQIYEHYTALTLPKPPLDWYRSLAPYLTGKVTYRETTPAGGVEVLKGTTTLDNVMWLVNGDVQISGKIDGQGVIVATGTVTVNGNISYKGDESLLALVALDHIQVDKATQADALLYSYGDFILTKETLHVYGGVLARDFVYDRELEVEHDPRFETSVLPGLPVHTTCLIRWEEQ